MNEKEEEILAKIKEILVDLFEMDEAIIVPEARLHEDLDIDSIDAVDLLIDLKKTIDMDISSEKLNEVRTIDDVIKVCVELSNG
ncbi:acyl carrier protein [Eionea flava]